MPAITQLRAVAHRIPGTLLPFWAFTGVVLFVAATSSWAWESDPAVVDESTAVHIGTFGVSQYLVDKSYNQFAAVHRARFGGAPDRSRVERWFRLFVAQQALKARLNETGWVNRVEVQSAVAQMSRQILTQRDGPLDRTLHRTPEFSEEQLRAVHEASARIFDALIVRFDDEESVTELLAGNPPPADLEKRLRAFGGSPGAPRIEIHDGEIRWPYHPFEEISSELANAKPGQLVGPLSRQLGAYFVLVRAETRQPIPGYDSVRQRLKRDLEELERIAARRVRKKHILNECRVSLDKEAIAQCWTRIVPGNRGPRIPANAIAGTEEKRLAAFAVRGERRQITERSFTDDFNRRFGATLPRDVAELATAIEALVVEEYDYNAARAAGLDREPKFLQDRRNFELNWALSLYEKEVLGPQIAISPTELEQYYADHREQYLQPFEVTGALYVFASEQLAQEGLKKLPLGEATAIAERVLESVIVRRDGPSVFPGVPNRDLLALPDGQRFGPVRYSDGYAIFLKQKAGSRQAPPLAEIESLVRNDVLRAKLDERELDLFQRNDGERGLQLEVDFSKYGIGMPFGSTPGEAQRSGSCSERSQNDPAGQGSWHACGRVIATASYASAAKTTNPPYPNEIPD